MDQFDTSIFTQVHLDSFAALAGEPLVDEDDENSARVCLAIAWDLVTTVGSPRWTLENAPTGAISTMLRAATRGWMNLAGFVSERADGVQLEREKAFASGIELTKQEIERLEDLSGKGASRSALKSTPLAGVNVLETRKNATRGRRGWGLDVMPYGYGMSPQQALPIPVWGDQIPEGLNVEPYRDPRRRW